MRTGRTPRNRFPSSSRPWNPGATSSRAPDRMAASHEAVEPAGHPRAATFAADSPSGEGGGSMTVTAVELDLGKAMDFRFPATRTRVVAARFDCGCEWRLVGEGVMKVRCPDHGD